MLLALQAPATAVVANIEALDGQLVALVAPCQEGGKSTAVIAIAAAESFPTGAATCICRRCLCLRMLQYGICCEGACC
jgi:hypothetical protein